MRDNPKGSIATENPDDLEIAIERIVFPLEQEAGMQFQSGR